MDEVAENSDELMERYLEGEEIDHEEIVSVLKRGVTAGRIFPVTCGAATRNLGTDRLLGALVEDLPSPAMRGALPRDRRRRRGDRDRARRRRRRSPPTSSRRSPTPTPGGSTSSASAAARSARTRRSVNVDRRQKERIGQLGQPLGKDLEPAAELGAGDIGAIAKLKETRAGDVLCERQEEVSLRAPRAALAGDGLRLRAEVEGRRGEGGGGGAAAHRGGPDARRPPRPADRRADHRRPHPGPRRGDGGADEEPLRGRDRAAPAARPLPGVDPPPAEAHARYKKQSGGRGQFADCQIEIEPVEEGAGLDFVNKIKGAAIPGGFIPAVEKGVVEAMEHGTVAGYPVKDVRVLLVDGKHHDVDSSEMAFKVAGSMAFKQAMEEADPVLLEPIVRLTVSCPDDVVGDVIGDLNSRRGHPLGMEPKGTRDRGQGGGADGRGARLRARPALDQRRPRRLRDGVRALRGGAGPPRRQGRRPGGRARRGRRLAPPWGGGPAPRGALEPLLGSRGEPERTCAVCGRSILPGERTRTFMTRKEGPRAVCDLCRERADALGWVDPVGRGANVGRTRPPADRRGPRAGSKTPWSASMAPSRRAWWPA